MATSLGQLVRELAEVDRAMLGELYDLGTRPNKLISAMLLKLHPAFLALIEGIFGDGLLASPLLGDTLHVFPPNDDERLHNLPEHQDFPYFLHSLRQVTIWLNVTDQPAGGVRCWKESHGHGPLPHDRTATGLYRALHDTGGYEAVDVIGGRGDIVIMDTCLVHQSIPSETPEARVTQLFRYSDISDPESSPWRWRGVGEGSSSPTWAEEFPHLAR